jgi:hypothetical protein
VYSAEVGGDINVISNYLGRSSYYAHPISGAWAFSEPEIGSAYQSSTWTRSAKALLHRLNLLSRKPNLYLSRPHQQRQNAGANYRPLIYQLDERGSRDPSRLHPGSEFHPDQE